MYIDLTPKQLALRDELRTYFDVDPAHARRTAWNEPRAPDYRAVVQAPRRRRVARRRVADGVRRARDAVRSSS